MYLPAASKVYPPGLKPTSKLRAELTNSQGELIEIRKVRKKPFTGQHILVMYDDLAASNVRAIHLLDKETIAWLLKELPKL